MKIAAKEKATDFRGKIVDELNGFAKFFKAPLPLYLFSTGNAEEAKEEFVKMIQEQNEMGKKLLKITNGFYSQCESLYKNILNLEEFKETAGMKIENLQKSIDEFKIRDKERCEEIKDLNEYISHLEFKVRESEENSKEILADLEKYQSQLKSIAGVHDSEIRTLIDFQKKEKESLQGTIYSLQKSLNQTETNLKSLESNFEITNKALKQEKILNEQYRSNISMLKSDVHELKLSVNSAKLKKSSYKQLFRASTKKDTCQTSDHSKNSEKLSSNSNDLQALEEEQSLAHDLNHFSVEVNDEFSMNNFSEFSENKNESLIVLFPQKPEEKLKISPGSSFSIVPKKNPPNIALSKTKNFSISPTLSPKSFKNLQMPAFFAVRSSALSKQQKQNLFAKVLNKANLNKKLHSLPTSPKNCSMKLETWTDTICSQKTEPPSMNITKNDEDEKSENHPEDPIKDYFITLCHKIKSNSFDPSKMSQIPTYPLYNSLVKSKIPLYRWPESIQLYLSKRINQ